MHELHTAVGFRERGGSTRPAEEYAGYTARDPRGQKIGRIERIFLNGSGEPEYIKVKMGFFGFKSILIPVLSVATDEERRTLLLQ
jgi:PRC-barrel domain